MSTTTVPAGSEPRLAPAGVRIASTLTWVVGVFTILGALSLGLMGSSEGDHRTFTMVVNILIGLAVCGAGMLIRRQLRLGVLLLVLAWAVPTVWALAQGDAPRGAPLLAIAALLLAGANWKHLH